MEEAYFTISAAVVTEYKERGSRFLGFAFPIKTVEDFKAIVKKLKIEHPKANHHCFAYRLGHDGNNFRSSDAGEPAGTAGKPILGQVDSKDLTDVAVFVVRYFGGTLLGVPGLIYAYKTTASLVLQLTPIEKKYIVKHFKISFNYEDLNIIFTILKKYGAEIVQQDFSLFSSITATVPSRYYFALRDDVEGRKAMAFEVA